MKQSPNWLADKTKHQIPVGGALEFYCNDTLKRPKKDDWDDDNEDRLRGFICQYHREFQLIVY